MRLKISFGERVLRVTRLTGDCYSKWLKSEGKEKPNKGRLRIYNLQIELYFMTSFSIENSYWITASVAFEPPTFSFHCFSSQTDELPLRSLLSVSDNRSIGSVATFEIFHEPVNDVIT